MKRIVIAGFGSAGYAAMIAAKKNAPTAEIIVLDQKEHDLMHPCGLPYSLEGIVPEEKILQNINLQAMKVKKIKGIARKVNTTEKTASYDGEGSGKLEYDALILATGSRPIIPPIKGIDNIIGKKLFTLTSVSDLDKIKNRLKGSKSAIVIGGGAIGLESAVAIRHHGIDVALAEAKEQILPGVLDPDMAAMVQEYLSEKNIKIMTSSMISEIRDEESLSCSVAGGLELKADIIILATGFRPDTEIAEKSGISYSSNGIIVDRYLKTSDDSVFAAGDCVSNWSIITHGELRAKLATSAYKHGTIAGINAAGGRAEYRGSAATFVTKIGGLEVAGTGFNTDISKQFGFDPVSGKINSSILPEYYPSDSTIAVKVIFDKKSGKILGGQAAGASGAAERINILSMAIEFGIGIEEIGRLELAYCPAVSEVYDPLLRAVDFGLRRIKK